MHVSLHDYMHINEKKSMHIELVYSVVACTFPDQKTYKSRKNVCICVWVPKIHACMYTCIRPPPVPP
jgi:hypothetical protein